MTFRRFPDFGKELRRPFDVSEHCYDCADFHDSCRGYGADRDKSQTRPQCEKYNRLPDVMPGTCGQRLPVTRRRDKRSTVKEQGASEQKGRPQRANARTEPRLCECGATLAKGRRLCDQCREQRRRQTRREYMRTYMQERRRG